MEGKTFKVISLLDYGAGNVRSLRNATKLLGFDLKDISSPEDIELAEVIIFPGVGCFGQAIQSLNTKKWIEPLRRYILAGKPFFGICLGMQSLFEGSEESPDDIGLGIIPGRVTKFQSTPNKSVRVPQIGWNGVTLTKFHPFTNFMKRSSSVYFVHSFCALPTAENLDYVLGVTDYEDQRYISMVQQGNMIATQFHPEKSGDVGLNILKNFLLKYATLPSVPKSLEPPKKMSKEDHLEPPDSNGPRSLNGLLTDFVLYPETQLVKRIVACLDVRSNDHGDLVVTKGDQYDVREEGSGARGAVRNLGKPVSLCARYYREGADEIVFLNITSFKKGVIDDLPMLQVLEQASEQVFVPLTVGGGIREYVDDAGKEWSALDVVNRYFRAGADKVSIGSEAVYAVEKYYISGGAKTGTTSIEIISKHYGAQAVVVSIDPKRVFVHDPSQAPGKTVVRLPDGETGPKGEAYCWWQATVKGGREARDLCAVQLAMGCEALGAGEIMLNSIDKDGQNSGYDLPLIAAVQTHVTVPVIASSGAGNPAHFVQVFEETNVLAALAAGIFHRNEVRHPGN